MKRYELHKEGLKRITEYLKNHNKEIWELDLENAKQLDNCQAWEISGKWRTVGEVNTIEDIKLLQSYQTIVAIHVVGSGEVIRLDKWSRTTSKQTTKWERRLGI